MAECSEVEISRIALARLAAAWGEAGSAVERLTDRELEVFQLIGEGRDMHEIARELHLSKKTVEAHRANIKEKLAAGTTLNGKKFKVHLDGYNFLPYLLGQTTTPPRQDFFYFSDDGDLTGLRYDNWKLVFME